MIHAKIRNNFMLAEYRAPQQQQPEEVDEKTAEEIKFHRHWLASGTIALHTHTACKCTFVRLQTHNFLQCMHSKHLSNCFSLFLRSFNFYSFKLLEVFFFSVLLLILCVCMLWVCCVFFFLPSLGSASSSSSSSSQTHMCVHKREYMYFVVIRLYYFFLLLLLFSRALGWFVRALFSFIFFFVCFVRSLLILFYFFSSFVSFCSLILFLPVICEPMLQPVVVLLLALLLRSHVSCIHFI